MEVIAGTTAAEPKCPIINAIGNIQKKNHAKRWNDTMDCFMFCIEV